MSTRNILPNWIEVRRQPLSDEEKEKWFNTDKKVSTSESVWLLTQPFFKGLLHEEMVAVMLDGNNSIRGIAKVASGDRSYIGVSIPRIFQAACACLATAIVLVHNHPSGDPTPSVEDQIVTRKIVEAGSILSIPLVDHLVVTDNRYVSFLDLGLIDSGGNR